MFFVRFYNVSKITPIFVSIDTKIIIYFDKFEQNVKKKFIHGTKLDSDSEIGVNNVISDVYSV